MRLQTPDKLNVSIKPRFASVFFQKWLIVWKLWLLGSILFRYKTLFLLRIFKFLAWLSCIVCLYCKFSSEKCQTHWSFLSYDCSCLAKYFLHDLGNFVKKTIYSKDNRFPPQGTRSERGEEMKIFRGIKNYFYHFLIAIVLLFIINI